MPDLLLTGHVLANPGDRDAWYRLGVGLHAERRWGAAAAAFARAIDWEASSGPATYQALTNFGWNLHLCGRSTEAAAWLEQATELCPAGDGTPHALLGQVLLTLGDDGAALRVAREAVRRLPESPIAHVALGFACFAAGKWEEGWREYEWRFRYKPEMYPARPYPLWRGERVSSLFVEAEQGLGDAIFGMRWLEEAQQRVGSLILFVQPELYAWARGWVPPEIEVLPLPRPLPAADAWCPVLSLPAAMGMGGPEGVGKFAPVRRWGPVFNTNPDGGYTTPIRIGICWRGNPAHEQAHHRDCPLAYWLRLGENPALELHSMQVGGTQELVELGAMGVIRDRAPELTNFADTARVVGELDLVVSVDTAVCHLAGAMGVPTWLLLNQRGLDYRWGWEDSSPWYPSFRIWRRSLSEDTWGPLLDLVDVELRQHRA